MKDTAAAVRQATSPRNAQAKSKEDSSFVLDLLASCFFLPHLLPIVFLMSYCCFLLLLLASFSLLLLIAVFCFFISCFLLHSRHLLSLLSFSNAFSLNHYKISFLFFTFISYLLFFLILLSIDPKLLDDSRNRYSKFLSGARRTLKGKRRKQKFVCIRKGGVRK